MSRIILEAVTVCAGYADFLSQVAPYNRPLLDRWIVVTTPDDTETREVCKKNSIECLVTEEHRRDGAFSKGRLIDRGLAVLAQSNWVVHLDADIALPADLHLCLADADLDPTCIYGCDRVNVVGYEAWKKVSNKGLRARSIPWMTTVSRDGCSVGARVNNPGYGWAPLGFLQLWHGSQNRRYPFHHGTCARTDIAHALTFDRKKRVLLPEFVVWHLESEKASMGANWAGRRTARFGPAAKTSDSSTPCDYTDSPKLQAPNL